MELPYSAKVTQQQDGFHGGAIGTIGDVAAGWAGLTLAPENTEVVTVEYKINFLTAHKNGKLRAVGSVLKPGKKIIVTKADIFHIDEDNGKSTLCACLQQTLMVVPKSY